MKSIIHTFQTRLVLDETTSAVLDKIAELLSKVERSLFADLISGKEVSDLKPIYCRRFQITARQFNACRVNVEGLIDSRKQLQVQQIETLKEKIKSLEKSIARLTGKTKYEQRLFFKKRRLNKLRAKLKRVEADREQGTVRVCFGTKKLFRSQFHLEKTGFQSFEQWKKEWAQARSKAFFCLGAKDETSGNQTCTASIQEDEKLTIRIRLPDGIVSHEKYLTIPNLYFKYGHKEIIASLKECQYRNRLQKEKNSLYSNYGQAISYRFVRDTKGWRLFVSTALSEPKWETSTQSGLIGVDINVDHLAIVETDHCGNPLSKQSIPLHLYGKDRNQSLAEIGNACAKVIQIAKEAKKDLIIEELDFKKKKADLRQSSKYCRMLSSFAYATIIQHLKSRAFRHGVQLHQVNPAFTSLLGRLKFAKRYGLSLHQAAALCIARRFFGFSERPPSHLKNIPDGKGGHITLTVPVRNRLKHA
jgi:IS605 OrfB family transposase